MATSQHEIGFWAGHSAGWNRDRISGCIARLSARFLARDPYWEGFRTGYAQGIEAAKKLYGY